MHQYRSLPARLFHLGLVIVALTVEVRIVAADKAQAASASTGEIIFVPPVRRAPSAALAPPPQLPPGAHNVTPLTFDVVTQRKPKTGRISTERQTVSRTRDLIHVRTDRTEWLFERNAIDPRRVSALLVHHPSRTIVVHEESDLRNTLGLTGWVDLLMLGVDASALSRLTPTAESRSQAGLTFRKHVARPDAAGLVEVWWDQDHLLPGAVMIRDVAGVINVSIERVKQAVDSTLFRSPSTRFAEYKVIDLAEWLAGH